MRDFYSSCEQYEAIIVEVLRFQNEDVITTSDSTTETTQDLHGEPHYW